jgi:hypothetical protein
MARLGAAGMTLPGSVPVSDWPADRLAGWPVDRPLAVSLNVILEGWAEGSAPGIGPMGNPLRPGVRDLQALSWAESQPGGGMGGHRPLPRGAGSDGWGVTAGLAQSALRAERGYFVVAGAGGVPLAR